MEPHSNLDDHRMEALIERYGNGVPRYTSYPTAPHFNESLAHVSYGELLDAIVPGEPISVYMHIPFCDRLCWFCGCNTKHTLKYDPVKTYVDHLLMELAAVRARLGFAPSVGHVHFGGGSPSFLSETDLARLGDALRALFLLNDETEICIEIDPSDVGEETLRGLTALGVTRVSVGVQDFDEEVQAAINRPQTYKQTRHVIDAMRDAGVRSVNIDALYGLPLQTSARLQSTIEQVIELSPDRIALFGYAHVPWVKKHQRMIHDEDLPDTRERFQQARHAEKQLCDAGYVKIGIDHFAKPDDSMAIANAEGHLRRNFQGYTTDSCTVLLGLGGSSISQYPGGYVQNIVATSRYQETVSKGEPPVAKGMRFCVDDKVRAFIINQLMCRFAISFEELRQAFGPVAEPYITEAELIAAQDGDGLCEVDADGFYITQEARALTRVVASRFDAYFERSEMRFSKAV
ncbi:MAG: oxygen-independent coproporphyrinogen III oxidase [Ahrensia sp.]